MLLKYLNYNSILTPITTQIVGIMRREKMMILMLFGNPFFSGSLLSTFLTVSPLAILYFYDTWIINIPNVNSKICSF